MKKFLPVLLLVIAVLAFMSVNVSAERDQSLYYVMTLGDFYNVEYDQVNDLANKGIKAEELPVVYFVADRAEVPALEIAELRLENKTWMTIIGEYKLSTSIFYVDVPGRVRYQPFVNIYKKFNKLDNTEWERVDFDDSDIVNLVNLKFMTINHSYSIYHIMKMRGDDYNYASINDEITTIKDRLAAAELAKK